MESFDVFVWVDGAHEGLGSAVWWEWVLDEDAVDGGVVVELFDFVEDVFFWGGGWEGAVV